MALGKLTISKRSEQRYPARIESSATIYYEDSRFDAEVMNESDSGLAIRLTSDVAFQSGRKVRVIFRRNSFFGVIKWIDSSPEGSTIGLCFSP